MSELGEELLEAIEKAFTEDYQTDRMLSGIVETIDNGGTWADAEAYAARVGELKSAALQSNITAAVLPNGTMSRELAKEILMPALEENYHLVMNAAAQVQESLNQKAGIGLRAVRPKMNIDRVQGIVEKVSSGESFDKVSWVLGEPIVNFTQSVADETLEENILFHARAGLSPKIERIAEGGCCKWCKALEGIYDYPAPRDVYRRHENCRCTVLYEPEKGRYTDVHSKKEFKNERDARIANAKRLEEKAATIAAERRKQAQEIIGIDIKGTTIAGITDHFFDQLKYRSITMQDVKEALENPLAVLPVRADKLGRKSFEVIGEYTTVVINPETGIAVTNHKTHTRLAEKLKKRR